MNITKYKVFLAYDFEKEEAWLNSMSVMGLELIDVGLCRYVFRENRSNRFEYRLELLDNLPMNRESQAYIAFLEETGAEYVGSVFRWAYFKKTTEDGHFQLFSDVQSRIAHYKRIMFLLFAVLPVNVISTFNMFGHYADEPQHTFMIMGTLTGLLSVLLTIGLVKIKLKVNGLKRESILKE